jgi:hypothetical protein
VALVATQLSYYDDGLTLEQLHEALVVLLRMEPNAQGELYTLWLEQGKAQLAPGEDASCQNQQSCHHQGQCSACCACGLESWEGPIHPTR